MDDQKVSEPAISHLKGFRPNQPATKRFFMGMFLLPWIVVFGWLFSLIILCVWFLSNPAYTLQNTVLSQNLESALSYSTILVISAICIFLLYCVAFFISAKFRWVRTLVLIVSFYCLCILSYQFFPFFMVLLSKSS